MNSFFSFVTIIMMFLQVSYEISYAKNKTEKTIQESSQNAVEGGTIILSLDEEPDTLNPLTATSIYSGEIFKWSCDSLLYRNLETYEWQPLIAEKWELSNNNKEVTFYMRKGLLFHDGHSLTADDVKFSFDVIFNDKLSTSHLKNYFEGIQTVTVVDTYTIKFLFKNNYFKNFEVIANQQIIPKHIYGDFEKNKQLNNNLVCSGPYKVEKYDPGQFIELKKFNKHLSTSNLKNFKGFYNYDIIKYKFITDEFQKVERLKRGDIDFLEWRNSEGYEKRATGDAWGKNVTKFKIENKIPKLWSYVGWNLERVIFKDKAVRLALSYLANREEINKKFYNNNSLLVSAPISPISEYAPPNVKPIPFNPKKALVLLKEAGWSDSDKDGILDKEIDGKKVDFKFKLVFANKDFEKIWIILKEDMRKVGIEMELKLMEFNALIKIKDEGDFDAIALSWAGGSIDPDPKQIWHSSSAVKGGANFIGYKNPAVDKLIDECRQIIEKSQRKPLVQKIYQMIAEDSPYLFMFSDRYYYYATTAKIKKIKPTFNYALGASTWWLDK